MNKKELTNKIEKLENEIESKKEEIMQLQELYKEGSKTMGRSIRNALVNYIGFSQIQLHFLKKKLEKLNNKLLDLDKNDMER